MEPIRILWRATILGVVLLSSVRAQQVRLRELHRMLPYSLDDTRALALGDVDGDGDVDALVGNLGLPNRLLLNDGNGLFADASAQLPAIVDATAALGLGDVDGDGDLDAFVGNSGSSGQERLYLNDGSGVFADATTQLPASSDTTTAVELGDVDGDGDLDALVGNGGLAGQDRLYLNDGSGSFLDGTAQLPAVLDNTRAVALGDVDGDGDLDVLVGNGVPAGQDRLYLNDGSGA